MSLSKERNFVSSIFFCVFLKISKLLMIFIREQQFQKTSTQKRDNEAQQIYLKQIPHKKPTNKRIGLQNNCTL